MRIGIVGAEEELHTWYVKDILEELGVEVLVVDTLNYPGRVTFSIKNGFPLYQEKEVEDIKVFYLRSVFYSHPPYDLEELRKSGKFNYDGWYEDYVAERERQSQLTSWLKILTLRGKKLVNPIESFDLHFLKPFQITLLQRNGIPVSRTLVTNNPRELLRFREEVKNIVYKPVAGGAACQLMSDKDWSEERLQLLYNAPVLFQEYIEGDNVRVYVLGDDVISSGIIYTDNVDYRGHEKRIEKIILPDEVKEICVKAMKICRMAFTGIDLKMKPDGSFVILECNPSPMFIGFEKAIGEPIGKKLAQFLISESY